MDVVPPRNRVLAQVLHDMLSAREHARDWVEGDAEFDAESKRLMGVMNQGDQETVTTFAVWVESLQQDLPITVSSADGGRNWNLEIDADGFRKLDMSDQQMLEAMSFLLFSGPEPEGRNSVVEKLMDLGLPDKLRRDLSDG